jgi:hypothetical protein
MAIDAATFKIRFPEFDSVPDARVDLFIADALLKVGEVPWGDLYEKGVFTLAAHYLQLSLNRQLGDTTGGGSVNQVTSRSIGDVSVSFGASSSDSGTEDYYRSTQYGQEYWAMMQCVGQGMVAIA